MLLWISILFLLLLLGPFYLLITGKLDLDSHWSDASRASAEIAPKPAEAPEAIVQIYGARAYNWRGMFAIHSWIATKEKDAKQYTVYEVIGWRHYRGQIPLYIHSDLPDRKWYNNEPWIMLDLRGEKAATAIKTIQRIINDYPFKRQYHTWPGPNSNTFVAHLVRSIPELAMELPTTAIGKDFYGWNQFIVKAPSQTGLQFSLGGLFGVTIAKKEGFEVNLLGLSFGLGWDPVQLKLPGIGGIPSE